MNTKRVFVVGLVILSVLSSAMIGGLNFTDNVILEDESTPEFNGTISPINFNFDKVVYAGAINKSSGERIVVKKKLIDLMEDSKIENENWSKVDKVMVKEDFNLIKVFNNQTFFNEIENQSSNKLVKKINNQTWVRVIIRTNNNLDFSKFSTKEGITVLNNLSDGFVGIINQKGFEELTNNLDIKEIQMDMVGHISLDESVPLINVRNDVWNLGYTGSGIDICVIDSGINANHPDLSGKIVGEYCYCSIGGGCCPNGQTTDTSAEDDNGAGTFYQPNTSENETINNGYISWDGDMILGKINSTSLINTELGYSVKGQAGVTNNTGFWMCKDSTCSTTCQVNIQGGIIVGCV